MMNDMLGTMDSFKYRRFLVQRILMKYDEAFQKLRPYGTTPKIIPLRNQYSEACTILPSSAQPPEMNGQAAYIVKYSKPIELGGEMYNYFILWADKDHIDKISSTL